MRVINSDIIVTKNIYLWCSSLSASALNTETEAVVAIIVRINNDTPNGECILTCII